jgi:Bacterial Ig-like domain (group 1)
MTDLNGSLMLESRAQRRRAGLRSTLAVCAAVLGLAACHDDSTTAPATATAVTVLSGGSQSGTVGAALPAPIVVQVKDQNGSAMAGVAVTLTVGTASGSVSATQLTTDANGQVTVSWTLGTVAGTDTLAAQVGSLPVLDVLATATPDVPATLVVVTGDNQNGAVGTALPTALTVKVVDQYGNAVPNATVTFADDANGTLAATTVTTDTNGMAADTITLGPNAGVDDVTASIQTASGPVIVTLHETAS